MSQYKLTDSEWTVIQPVLSNMPRGVPRADYRQLLNGIFRVLRTGSLCGSLARRIYDQDPR